MIDPRVTPPRPHWLNRQRIRIYSAALLLAMAIYGIRSAWLAWRIYGEPNGFDFVGFWSASHLLLQGTPLAAYSSAALNHAALTISPRISLPELWPYPPNFLLLVAPLALLPAWLSYLIFTLFTTVVFVLLARRALPLRDAWLPIVAFPALWVNAGYGQNACVTAGLAFGAFLLLEKRPILAGVCIGLLSMKPHLALLFPIALACAGLWRVFWAAAATALVFTAMSIAVFGLAVVPLFVHAIHIASLALNIGAAPWSQGASAFSALRLLGASSAIAYAAQAGTATFAALTVGWVWRTCHATEVRALALVAGTMLTSPYLFIYDTVWLGIPLAMYTAQALRTGWLRGEREVFCLAWAFAPIGLLLGAFVHIGIGPFVFAALLWFAVRRARQAHPSTPMDNDFTPTPKAR